VAESVPKVPLNHRRRTKDVATARKKNKEAGLERKSAPAKAEARPRVPALSARPVWPLAGELSGRALSGDDQGERHLVPLNPETNNRVRMVPTDPDKGPVERTSLMKGYEISKNRYVIRAAGGAVQSRRIQGPL
jgi:hypothetical protein